MNHLGSLTLFQLAPPLRAAIATLLLIALNALAACRAGPKPLDPTSLSEDPRRARVLVAYQQTIRRLVESDDENWHSGWIGNLFVNHLPGDHRGLCYHWQAATYDGIRDALALSRLEARGVAVAAQSRNAHFAVILFDPHQTLPDALLRPPSTPPARDPSGRSVYTPGTPLVLDPWRRGRPDIYELQDWLASARRKRLTIELEDLEAQWHADRRPQHNSANAPSASSPPPDR